VVSYNRFVELEKEIGISLALFIKKVLLGKCTGISFVDSTPCVFAVTKEYTSTRHARVLPCVVNVPWAGSLVSN